MSYSSFAKEEVDYGFPVLGIASAWFGVIIVGFTAVGYSLSTPLGQSTTKPVVDMLQFMLIALILASMLYIFVRAGEGIKVTAVPLVINIGTLIILRLVPFAAIWEEARFHYHWPTYQTIVQKVESGDWQPGSSGIIMLPAQHQNLSADNGRIWVQQEGAAVTIFFMTEQQGIGQHWSICGLSVSF